MFGLVVDSDADKGKGGNVIAKPSLRDRDLAGNFHLWYLLTRAISAPQAKPIGDAIRASSGADQDTGVVTQCYRVAGTPNFPSAAKRARGRVNVEPTRIFEYTGRLWDPDELMAAFASPVAVGTQLSCTSDHPDEATLPDDLLDVIRHGARPGADRSKVFHDVVAQLTAAELDRRCDRRAAREVSGRDRQEVRQAPTQGGRALLWQGRGGHAQPPAAGTGPALAAASSARPERAPPQHHVIPTIRIVAGKLPEIAAEIARALIAGRPIFARGGTLVEPVSETTIAANGRKTITARLRPLSIDSLLWPIADAAIFQSFNRKRNAWVDVDPPLQLVRMVLAGERQWTIPRVSGIITTPTLRADGSLLADPGYDPQSGLYLLAALQLSPIPERPTKEQARAALDMLIDLLSSSRSPRRSTARSRSAGLLTAHVRGSLPTAP